MMSPPGQPRIIAVSGANGFIGRHLTRALRQADFERIVALDRGAFVDVTSLATMIAGADAVVHLAGANRGSPDDIHRGNVEPAQRLVEAMDAAAAVPHVIFASSSQRDSDTVYGHAKQHAEAVLRAWAERTGARLTTLVVPNVFGPGCRPHYNSVVATFAHQLSRGDEPIVVEDRELGLVYVGDLVQHVIGVLQKRAPTGVAVLEAAWRMRVSELLDVLRTHQQMQVVERIVPATTSRLHSLLYSTLLSYQPYPLYRYAPELHADPRGVLMECVRHQAGGQVFFSTTTEGVVRGNHYHTRKIEKFVVLRGEAAVRLRHVDDTQVISYELSGQRPEVIDIPLLHAHSIENVGHGELLTLFWSSELFDAADADTFPEEV